MQFSFSNVHELTLLIEQIDKKIVTRILCESFVLVQNESSNLSCKQPKLFVNRPMVKEPLGELKIMVLKINKQCGITILTFSL